jgi:DNA-binding MarR family transcriptional regulator
MRHRRTPDDYGVRQIVELLSALHEFTAPAAITEFTPAQFNLIRMLDRDTPVHAGELARRRGVTRAAVSHALKLMEKMDLVTRRRDPRDRRFVQVRLTNKGHALKCWPLEVSPPRVAFIMRNLTLDQRVILKSWLEVAVRASLGRDYWKELGPLGIGFPGWKARASPV